MCSFPWYTGACSFIFSVSCFWVSYLAGRGVEGVSGEVGTDK